MLFGLADVEEVNGLARGEFGGELLRCDLGDHMCNVFVSPGGGRPRAPLRVAAKRLAATRSGALRRPPPVVNSKNKSGVAGRTATPLRYGDRPASGPFGAEARTDAVRVVGRGGAGVRLPDAIR